jgi:HSP20 family protein
MSSLGEWDSLKQLLTVQKQMNKLFESALERTDFDAHDEVDTWAPLADVHSTPDSLVICLELPGLEQDEIDVHVEGDELLVCGERKIERERDGERFHRVERAYGKFSRRFHLPSTVDRERVEASYREGLLRIEMPQQGAPANGPIRVAVR